MHNVFGYIAGGGGARGNNCGLFTRGKIIVVWLPVVHTIILFGRQVVAAVYKAVALAYGGVYGLAAIVYIQSKAARLIALRAAVAGGGAFIGLKVHVGVF